MTKHFILMFGMAMFAIWGMSQTSSDKVNIYYHDHGSASVLSVKCVDLDSIVCTDDGMMQYVYTSHLASPYSTMAIADVDSVVFSIVKTVVLADKQATPRTKSLFAFLQNNYGKKCLSATMANVAWDQKGADKVYQLTGKYPAINCFDFIHMNASGTKSWIDYSNITPVTDWDKAGGIVSLEWHFKVPFTEASDSNHVTFNPNETTFKCGNIFTEGTWENKWFYKQMDKTCSVLLQLQNAGIVALWRPFHEAAGNACAKTWHGTAWFWWGADGAENYRRLWQTMFTYFQSKGIHNLIWNWCTQNYGGDESSYNNDADYYPGDGYVDMVCRDLYGYSAAKSSREFKSVQARYPDKMISLAECGNDVSGTTIKSHQGTISMTWKAGGKWLYFMPWYDYNYLNGTSSVNYMCDDSFWTDAMSQDYVVDRTQVIY